MFYRIKGLHCVADLQHKEAAVLLQHHSSLLRIWDGTCYREKTGSHDFIFPDLVVMGERHRR